MKGYPKNLNSREDYEYVRTHYPKEMWKDTFQSLIDTSSDWFNIGEADGDGITDDTHMVVNDEETGKKYQYERKENPYCIMNQLGYTEEEIRKYIDE